MTSPVLNADDLVASYISNGDIRIPFRRVMQALIFGDRNGFTEDDNHIICNVFAIAGELRASPLVKLSILKLLIDKAGEIRNVADSYLTVRQVHHYFEPMQIIDAVLDKAIADLLSYRLVEPYDPTDDKIFPEQRIAITHSGRMHSEMSLNDAIYVSQMAFATPLSNMGVVEEIRAIKSAKMDNTEWKKLRNIFIDHCLSEDAKHCHIPADSSYDGQRSIRRDIKHKWVDVQVHSEQSKPDDELPAEVTSPETVGRSYAKATVVRIIHEKGYGFVNFLDGSPDVFMHLRTLKESGYEELGVGDLVTCDTAPTQTGTQVIKVHSVESITDREKSGNLILGNITHYDNTKGFGFVRSPSVEGDIFIHTRILTQCGFGNPQVGMAVQVAIVPGQSGRGPQAIYIKHT
jgi:cold shock CspA family protein